MNSPCFLLCIYGEIIGWPGPMVICHVILLYLNYPRSKERWELIQSSMVHMFWDLDWFTRSGVVLLLLDWFTQLIIFLKPREEGRGSCSPRCICSRLKYVYTHLLLLNQLLYFSVLKMFVMDIWAAVWPSLIGACDFIMEERLSQVTGIMGQETG